ncbi:3-hydroxyacyl-CoA dehydrogenase family protein [Chloroflexota bacterium]
MEIRNICVLGAGMMGYQIAQLVAINGYDVTLVDMEDTIVKHALDTINGNLKKFFVDKGKISPDEMDAVMERIKGTTVLKEAVNGVEIVIETVSEQLELKQRIFKELDEICAPETILASNTTTFMITDIGSLTRRQGRTIGIHFFNPVAAMKLIEIVRGVKTSDETYEVIKGLAIKLGKEIVTVNDSPGLAVSRLYLILVNEAARLVHEGVASAEDVDKGCRLGLGHAMGPLRTSDMINGIGIANHGLAYMRAILGDDYNPCPLIRKKFLAGEMGESAGKGFHSYD